MNTKMKLIMSVLTMLFSINGVCDQSYVSCAPKNKQIQFEFHASGGKINDDFYFSTLSVPRDPTFMNRSNLKTLGFYRGEIRPQISGGTSTYEIPYSAENPDITYTIRLNPTPTGDCGVICDVYDGVFEGVTQNEIPSLKLSSIPVTCSFNRQGPWDN